MQSVLCKSNQIYFLKMQDKYATTTLRIAKHRQENMAKPEGLKHTKLLAILLRYCKLRHCCMAMKRFSKLQAVLMYKMHY